MTAHVIGISAAISMCEDGGEHALALLHRMREAGKTPNIHQLQSRHQWVREFLTHAMRMSANVVGFSAVISTCEQGAWWEQALGVKLNLRARGMRDHLGRREGIADESKHEVDNIS